MLEIEFSIIEDDPGDLQVIAGFLEDFQEQHKVNVHLVPMSWEQAWQDLFSYVLKGKGPDVTHVGSTWSSSLVEMNALRPFTPREVAEMGRPEAFIPADWQSVLRPGDAQVWAIPWYSYIYLIGYRRDLLQHAGVDELIAFRTAQDFSETIRRLQTAGIEIPLAFPAFPDTDQIHTAASWVWGAGGDFISDDGKRVLFNRPEALAGLKAYFELYRGLSPQARELNDEQSLALFAQGRAAMIVTNSDAIQTMGHGGAIPEVRANLGTAVPSSVPWFGGGNLVIWRHAREHPERERAAVALVSYLASRPVQVKRAHIDGTLPARLDALPELSLEPASLGITLQQAVKTGRPYKTVPLWRRIEYQLGQELVQIRTEVWANPNADIDEILHGHIDSLARRMSLMLSQ